MAITVSGTSITFNDGTVQTTAAGSTSTDFGAVGTYAVLMMGSNTNVAAGGTVAGSSLRYNQTSNATSGGVSMPFAGLRVRTNVSTYDGGGTALSGTWRKMNSGPTYNVRDIGCGSFLYEWYQSLYIRIS